MMNEAPHCDNCERCTWNEGPNCGQPDHPLCERCGHCRYRHQARSALFIDGDPAGLISQPPNIRFEEQIPEDFDASVGFIRRRLTWEPT